MTRDDRTVVFIAVAVALVVGMIVGVLVAVTASSINNSAWEAVDTFCEQNP